MSLSIQSSIHAVAKINHDVEVIPAKKVAEQVSQTAGAASKAPVSTPKTAPKLDERTQIEQLALHGDSNEQIAATIGLPESVVALTLGDAAIPTASPSADSALVALSGRLSVSA